MSATISHAICYAFSRYSGVVQLVARQPLELVILVRVQAPEPFLTFLRTRGEVASSNTSRHWAEAQNAAEDKTTTSERYLIIATLASSLRTLFIELQEISLCGLRLSLRWR